MTTAPLLSFDLDRTYPAGARIRLTAGDAAEWTVIDLLDSELVGLPHVRATLDERGD